MLITVIIPTFNRAHYLYAAIRSILRQDADCVLDILIVDDGSTDETQKLVADLMERHRELRYVRQDNAGVAAARNLGLTNLLPETEIVTFLDSDDVMPKDRIATDLAALQADESLDLTYGRLMMVEEIDDLLLEVPPHSARQIMCVPQLSLALFRRAIIEKTGLFDPDLRLGEDTDFLLRMFETGARFLQTDTITLYYRRHTTNLTSDRREAKRYHAMVVLRSIRRQRADASRVLHKPDFDMGPTVYPTQINTAKG